jgi:allantoin racemase
LSESRIANSKEKKLRIMLVELGEFYPRELAIKEAYARSVCSPGTTVVLRLVEISAPLPADFSRFSLYPAGILQRVKEAEKEGFDAVLIDCFTDSGLEAAKIAVNIPVVAPAESSLHISCLLADKFGWIIPMDEGIPFHWRQVKNYGMADRVTSIKGLNLSLLEIHRKKDDAETKLIKLAQELLDSGAQLISIGCTGILPALGIGSAMELSKKIGVPVIDPLAIALKTAETLVSLNLRQSSLAYPKTARFS